MGGAAADGRYVHAVGASDGAVDHVPGWDGLHIDLTGLWAEVDALDRPATPT